jgi:phage protein U
MADRGDAELIRSIGSIVGDVAGMFQATPQELQAARLAADESSQARTMEFTERMKQVDYDNRLMADEIERKGDMFADNLNLIRTAELDLATANVKYDAYVSKKGATDKQNSLFETIDAKKRNALGISDLQLQDQEEELQYLMGALQHDVQMKDEAERDFDFYQNLEGGEGRLSAGEEAKMKADFKVGQDDGMTTEEWDEKIGYVKNAENEYWGRAGEKEDVRGDRADRRKTKLEGDVLELGLEKLEEDKKLHDAGGYTDIEKQKLNFDDKDSYDVILSGSDKAIEEANKWNNAMDIIGNLDKNTPNSTWSRKYKQAVGVLVGGEDWGDLTADDILTSPDIESDLADIDFNGSDKGIDPKNERRAQLITLVKNYQRTNFNPVPQEFDADVEAENEKKEQERLKRLASAKKEKKVIDNGDKKTDSYILERLKRTNSGQFIGEKAKDVKAWWNSYPDWSGKKDTPEFEKLDNLMEDYIASKKVVESFEKRTGKPATPDMRKKLLEKQKAVNIAMNKEGVAKPVAKISQQQKKEPSNISEYIAAGEYDKSTQLLRTISMVNRERMKIKAKMITKHKDKLAIWEIISSDSLSSDEKMSKIRGFVPSKK